MYLAALKTLLVLAIREVFDDEYPQNDFRKVNVGIEYPVDKQGYPGIWVDYSDTGPLRQAGVSHTEQTVLDGIGGGISRHTRFRFEGVATFTIVALSSLERDRLYDELIRVLAFGAEDEATAQFRAMIEDNDLIAVNAKFDELQVGGNAAAPGTPWDTDEIIYERTISLDLLGEFIADPVAGNMVPLSGFLLTITVDTTIEPRQVDQVPAPDGGNAWI